MPDYQITITEGATHRCTVEFSRPDDHAAEAFLRTDATEWDDQHELVLTTADGTVVAKMQGVG